MRTPRLPLPNTAAALATLALGVLSASCGNSYLQHGQLPYSSNPADVLASSGNYTCTGTDDILPSDGQQSGVDAFQICTATVASNILIHGQTAISPVICVFPAETTGSGTAMTYPGPESGTPLMSCSSASLTSGTSGIAMSFNVTFNALYIVEGPYEAQMEACLEEAQDTGNLDACPPYSYGEFR